MTARTSPSPLSSGEDVTGRDRPILFSAPMVRALLAGTKTQTRRVLKPRPQGDVIHYGWQAEGGAFWTDQQFNSHRLRIWAGDRLWVRESLRAVSNDQGVRWLSYAADGKDVWPTTQWSKERDSVPSIHMPRWASRLTLTVTDVRVQRLQDISTDDAEAEGCPPCDRCGDCGWINSGPDGGWQCDEPGCGDAYVDQYARLWDSINGTGSWASNPWIAAYTFTVERRNIDAPRADATPTPSSCGEDA